MAGIRPAVAPTFFRGGGVCPAVAAAFCRACDNAKLMTFLLWVAALGDSTPVDNLRLRNCATVNVLGTFFPRGLRGELRTRADLSLTSRPINGVGALSSVILLNWELAFGFEVGGEIGG